MNLFNWFFNKSGKFALSALQTAGIATVVGVAGLGAWNYLSTPSQEDTFSPSSYNPGEIVYVSGNAGGGAYTGAPAGRLPQTTAGGNESSVRVSARTLERVDAAERRYKASEEMAEQSSYSAYQTGETEGLGMGANYAREQQKPSGDPLAEFGELSGAMGNLSNMMSQVQTQAALAGKTGNEAPAATPGNRLQTAALSTQGDSGNAFNSTFTVQDSGKTARSGSVRRSSPQGQQGAGDVVTLAQQEAAATLRGGAYLRGKAQFGPGQDSLAGGGRNATVRDGRYSKEKNELEFIRKRSADAARNRFRSTNEGARAFLASTQVSAGMYIEADNVTTGQDQGSQDYESDYQTQLRGIKAWASSTELKEIQHEKDRASLVTNMLTTLGVCAFAVLAIAFLKYAGLGWAAGIVTAVAAGFLVNLSSAIDTYANKWGGELATVLGWVEVGTLTGALVLAWFLPKIATKGIEGLAKNMGMGEAGSGWLASGGAAGVGAIGGGLAGKFKGFKRTWEWVKNKVTGKG